MTKQLDELIEDCLQCAETYAQSPGLVSHATIIDLYQAIARLARIVKAVEAQ